MIYAYAVISAALVPILDRYLPILRESYSLWLVPVMFLGFFLAFIILHIGIVILLYLLVDIKKPPKCYKFYRFLAEITMPMVLSVLRVRVKVTNEELLPENTRFVLISNHTHLFDPLIFLGKFPQAELSFIGKQEIADKMRLTAGFMWSMKGDFVDRENLRSGAKVIINSVKKLKNDEVSICVFPEGTRSKDGNVGEFKSGAFRMAQKAGVPTVVCAISGVPDILHRFPLRSTEVHLDFLKIFTNDDYEKYSETQLSETSRNLIEAKIKGR